MPTHVFIDAASFPAAQGYFSASQSERTAGGTLALQASHLHSVADFTLANVLSAITNHAAAGDDIIIVCHGTTAGMSPRLSEDTDVTANSDALNLLSSGRSAASIHDSLRLSEAQAQALKDQRAAVQALGLRRVEIRGCKIGQHQSALSAIRRFFGAGTVGAPRVRNSYARVSFRTNGTEANFRSITQRRGQVFEVGGGRVGFVIEMTGHSRFRVTEAWASSPQVLDEWQRQMFSFRSLQRGELFIHGQFVDGALVFPTRQNYANNLAEFCGADDLGIANECTEPVATH